MNGSFIIIKTKTGSKTYVNVNDINSVEEDGLGNVIVTAYDRIFHDVVEINNVPCDSMDDVANKLNLFDI